MNYDDEKAEYSSDIEDDREFNFDEIADKSINEKRYAFGGIHDDSSNDSGHIMK